MVAAENGNRGGSGRPANVAGWRTPTAIRRVSTVLVVVSLAIFLPACTQESRDQIRDAAGSISPTRSPGGIPSASVRPTRSPRPTEEPTEEPQPTEEPTEEPQPTEEPTEEPQPTEEPTEEPQPTEEPTEEPQPTEEPTEEPQPTEEPTEEPQPTESAVAAPSEAPAKESSSKDAERAAGWVLLVLVLLGVLGAVIFARGRRLRERRQAALEAAAACAQARDALTPLLGTTAWAPDQVAVAIRQIDHAAGNLRSLSPPDEAARIAAERAAITLGSAADVLSRPAGPEGAGEPPETALGLAVRELDLAVAELRRSGRAGETESQTGSPSSP